MQLQLLKQAARSSDVENQSAMHQSYFNQNAVRNLNNPEILIGVSSGLLSGEDDRFDHQHNKFNAILELLGKHFVIRSFCPEAEIDFGVNKTVQQNDWNLRLSGYVFRENSSSYPVNGNKVINNEKTIENAVCTSNSRFNVPLFPVIEDYQLADPALKENFIQRVCVMHRWQQLAKQDTSIYPLIRFHQQHYHLYLSHDPDKAGEIERILSLKNTIDIDELHTIYIQTVIDALSSIPSRKNHVFVMQQLLVDIEPYLTREDQQEIEQSIEQYQLGKKSIKIPLTLLRYHVGIHSSSEVANSVYLFPYPQERILCEQNETTYEIELPIAS
jgi:uncharacterized protein YbgA (DUF1722 family)